MPGLKENLKDNEVRCLIYEIGNSDAVGFIEASTGTDNRREIGIAILPEYRRKGLGYAAWRIYCADEIFDRNRDGFIAIY